MSNNSVPEDSDIVDCFTTDTDIEPLSRETTVSLNPVEEEMRLFAAERTIMKSLWKHPHVSVDRFSVVEEGTYTTIQPQAHQGEDIVGVWCDAPIGLLNINLEPRDNNNLSNIISGY